MGRIKWEEWGENHEYYMNHLSSAEHFAADLDDERRAFEVSRSDRLGAHVAYARRIPPEGGITPLENKHSVAVRDGCGISRLVEVCGRVAHSLAKDALVSHAIGEGLVMSPAFEQPPPLADD